MIDAQLISPGDAVCLGNHVTFTCHHAEPGRPRWRIYIPLKVLAQIVLSNEVRFMHSFQEDPGFGFQLQISSITPKNITTELQVTAVRQLNNVSVECAGSSGTFVSVILVAVGKLSKRYNNQWVCFY